MIKVKLLGKWIIACLIGTFVFIGAIIIIWHYHYQTRFDQINIGDNESKVISTMGNPSQEKFISRINHEDSSDKYDAGKFITKELLYRGYFEHWKISFNIELKVVAKYHNILP